MRRQIALLLAAATPTLFSCASSVREPQAPEPGMQPASGTQPARQPDSEKNEDDEIRIDEHPE